jgi:hypothetical protein
VTALHHLGVTGDDRHPRGVGSARDGVDLRAQVLRGQALLEDEREAQRQRAGARDGQVVDGAVDRQLADRATREAQRLDHVGVRGHGQLRAVDADGAGVGHLVERRGVKGGRQQALDQALRRLAASAVGHVDPRVAELRALAPGGLDDVEDRLLALGDRRTVGHHTTSRSRAKRPKL